MGNSIMTNECGTERRNAKRIMEKQHKKWQCYDEVYLPIALQDLPLTSRMYADKHEHLKEPFVFAQT